MVENVVTDFILVIAVVVIGLIIFGFIGAYFAPRIAFSQAQQSAGQLASSTTVVTGPLLVDSKTGIGSFVVEMYNPSFSGNVTVLVFTAPAIQQPSVGILTPTTSVNYQVYLPNGGLARTTQLNTVYDLSGNNLIQGGNYQAYIVQSNTPVTVDVPVQNGQMAVVWLVYNAGGFNFRIGYSSIPLTQQVA